MTCSVEFCDKPVKAVSLCTGHYRQKRAGQEFTPLKKYIRRPVVDGMRVCKTCEVNKPLDEYYRHGRGITWTECKQCVIKRNRANTLAKRERDNA